MKTRIFIYALLLSSVFFYLNRHKIRYLYQQAVNYDATIQQASAEGYVVYLDPFCAVVIKQDVVHYTKQEVVCVNSH